MTHTTDIRREGQRPALLDLFCCAGGAGTGYHRAGFRVEGVDIVDRSARYPFTFRQGDALTVLADLIESGAIAAYSAIHASPPCQGKCALTVGTNQAMGWGGIHTDLVAPTRELLDASGLPYVIEQPDGKADVRKDITLCGEMFGHALLAQVNAGAVAA